MKNGGLDKSFPIKGAACGIRPDIEELGEETGFDFSAAKQFLTSENSSAKFNETNEQKKTKQPYDSKTPPKTKLDH